MDEEPRQRGPLLCMEGQPGFKTCLALKRSHPKTGTCLSAIYQSLLLGYLALDLGGKGKVLVPGSPRLLALLRRNSCFQEVKTSAQNKELGGIQSLRRIVKIWSSHCREIGKASKSGQLEGLLESPSPESEMTSLYSSHTVIFSSSIQHQHGGEQEMDDCFNLSQLTGTRRSCNKVTGKSQTGQSASFLLSQVLSFNNANPIILHPILPKTEQLRNQCRTQRLGLSGNAASPSLEHGVCLIQSPSGDALGHLVSLWDLVNSSPEKTSLFGLFPRGHMEHF